MTPPGKQGVRARRDRPPRGSGLGGAQGSQCPETVHPRPVRGASRVHLYWGTPHGNRTRCPSLQPGRAGPGLRSTGVARA